MPRKKTVSIAKYGVYDSKDLAFTDLTVEQMQRAQVLHQHVEAATLVAGVALKEIRDERLYLALGVASFSEYCELLLPFSRQTAYKYISVAERIGRFLPITPEGVVSPVRQLMEHEDETNDSEENGDTPQTAVLGLGLRKLYELTRVEDAVFEDLVTKGRVVMPDGETEYTVEDLLEMKSSEYTKVMEDARMERDAYRARIQQLEEKLRLEKSERASDADKLKKAESLIDEARHLEALYTRDKLTYEQTETLLQEAQHHLFESRRRLMNVEISDDSGDGLKKLLRECIDEIQRQAKSVTYQHWDFLLQDDYERVLFMDWQPGQDLKSAETEEEAAIDG